MDPISLTTRPPIKPVNVADVPKESNSVPEIIDTVPLNSETDDFSRFQQGPFKCDDNVQTCDDEKSTSIRQRSKSFLKNILKRAHSFKRSKSEEPKAASNASSLHIASSADLKFDVENATDDDQIQEANSTQENTKKRGLNIFSNTQWFKTSSETNFFVRDPSTTHQDERVKKLSDDKRSASYVKDGNEHTTKTTEEPRKESSELNSPEPTKSEGQKSSNTIKQRSSAFVKNICDKSHFTKKSKSSSTGEEQTTSNPTDIADGQVVANADNIEVDLNPLDDNTNSMSIAKLETPQNVHLKSADFVRNILHNSTLTKSRTVKTKDEPSATVEQLELVPDNSSRDTSLDVETAEPSVSSSPLPHNQKKPKFCHPIVDKLKTMADKQYHKGKKSIKKFSLKSNESIDLEVKQPILNLKVSPRAERRNGYASYVVKHQDSDDVLEIVDMDESPSEVRRRREQDHAERLVTVLVPDEIIELGANHTDENLDTISVEPTIVELLEEEFKSSLPQKSPRKSKAHHYEDIEDDGHTDPLVADFAVQLRREDESLVQQLLETSSNVLRPLDSVESADSETAVVVEGAAGGQVSLAPISSLDTTSSDDETIQNQVTAAGVDVVLEIVENSDLEASGRKSNMKREASPGIEKKVTFSASTEAVEGEREEDDKEVDGRWSNMR